MIKILQIIPLMAFLLMCNNSVQSQNFVKATCAKGYGYCHGLVICKWNAEEKLYDLVGHHIYTIDKVCKNECLCNPK